MSQNITYGNNLEEDKEKRINLKAPLKKITASDIQASPIILLTVEYPQNGKVPNNGRGSIRAVEFNENVQKIETIPCSFVQLEGNTLRRLEYSGKVEDIISKSNSTIGPVFVFPNAGQDVQNQVLEVGTSQEAPTESGSRIVFSPNPQAVVSTVMPLKNGSWSEEIAEEVKNVEESNVDEEGHSSEDSCSSGSDNENVKVISDKPVTCRARASLPASFLRFRKSSLKRQQGKGVFARRDIPPKSRFGPMEGILVPEKQYVHEYELVFTVITGEGVMKLDVSDENTSNWMRYVRRAHSIEEHNLSLYQINDQLYFKATKRIRPGEELKVWYARSYAKSRNLPLIPNRKRFTFSRNQLFGTTYSRKETEGTRVNSYQSEWKCSSCQRIFRNATLFNLHVLTHAADDLETSENCDKLNSSSEPASVNENQEESFQYHNCVRELPDKAASSHSQAVTQTSHPNPKCYDCPMCSEIFFRKPNFQAHIHSHAIDGYFHCPLCPKKFSQYKYIRCHVRKNHSGKDFICKRCPKRFSTPDKLKNHLLSHSDVREFTCAECGKKFKRKDKLAVHIKEICSNNERTVAKALRTLQKVSDTNYLVNPFNCHVCKLGFKRRGMLINHVVSRHPEISLNSIPELNQPIYQEKTNYICLYCGKVYKSSTKRKAHIIKMHPGRNIPPNTSTSGENESYSVPNGCVTKLPQACEFCPRQYASRAKLYQHQRKKHPNDIPASILNPKKHKLGLAEERDEVQEAVEKVTASDMFLPELPEYELSANEVFLVESSPLKSSGKGEEEAGTESSGGFLTGLCQAAAAAEARSDYFQASLSGLETLANTAEIWDPLSLCLSPPSAHLLSST